MCEVDAAVGSRCSRGKEPFVSYGNKADLVAHSQTSDSEFGPCITRDMCCIYSLLSPTENLPKQNLWGKAQESAFYPVSHVILLQPRFENGTVTLVPVTAAFFLFF